MRIGLTAEWLGTQAGGLETYSRKLIEALPTVAGAHDRLLAFCSDPQQLRTFSAQSNTEVRHLGSGSRWLSIPVTLPFQAARARLDLLHATTVAPLWSPVPMVLTVHDLAFRHHPDYFPPLIRARLALLIGWGVRRARRIIAVSQATKADLIATYGLDAERISVVHEGVDAVYRPIEDPELMRAARARLGLPARYVLYVGRLHVRKNLTRLLEAFAALRSGPAAGYSLVLVGRRLYDADPLMQAVRDLGLVDHVVFTGHVPDAELPFLYNGATAFVYPSLFEGFGLPPLEAMACGVPTLVSNATSLPEIVGDGALLADPRSGEDIARKLATMLSTPQLRQRLRRAALARARLFTWERTARATLAVYHEAIGASAGAVRRHGTA